MQLIYNIAVFVKHFFNYLLADVFALFFLSNLNGSPEKEKKGTQTFTCRQVAEPVRGQPTSTRAPATPPAATPASAGQTSSRTAPSPRPSPASSAATPPASRTAPSPCPAAAAQAGQSALSPQPAAAVQPTVTHTDPATSRTAPSPTPSTAARPTKVEDCFFSNMNVIILYMQSMIFLGFNYDQQYRYCMEGWCEKVLSF